MKFLTTIAGVTLMLALSSAALAQEPELVNEIVARVNNDIITRADYLAALQDFKAELGRQLQQAGKGEAELNAEFEKLKGTVLDILIEDYAARAEGQGTQHRRGSRSQPADGRDLEV